MKNKKKVAIVMVMFITVMMVFATGAACFDAKSCIVTDYDGKVAKFCNSSNSYTITFKYEIKYGVSGDIKKETGTLMIPPSTEKQVSVKGNVKSVEITFAQYCD